jgi:hypothetical protein
MVISTITSDLTKLSLMFIFNFTNFIKTNSGNGPNAFLPRQSRRDKSVVPIPWSRAILRSSQCLIWSKNSTPSLEAKLSILAYEIHPPKLITSQLRNATTSRSISISLILILSSYTCSGMLDAQNFQRSCRKKIDILENLTGWQLTILFCRPQNHWTEFSDGNYQKTSEIKKVWTSKPYIYAFNILLAVTNVSSNTNVKKFLL